MELNLRWIQQRKEEEIAAEKERELQERVQRWELDRSRDESEYLRKRESSKLVSKLEQMTQHPDRYEACTRGKGDSINPTTRVARQLDVPERSNQSIPRSGSFVQTPLKELAKESPSTFQVIIKSKALQQASSKSGMHFRNQLPANYTPTRSSSTAQRERLDSASTSRSFVATTGVAGGSSQRRGSQSTTHDTPERDDSDDSDNSESGNRAATRADDERVLQNAHIAGTKFEAYYAMYAERTTRDRPEGASAPVSCLGTIPSQHEPADPEYQHLHLARAMRQTVAVDTKEHQASGSHSVRPTICACPLSVDPTQLTTRLPAQFSMASLPASEQVPRTSFVPAVRLQESVAARQQPRSSSRAKSSRASSASSPPKSGAPKKKGEARKGSKSPKSRPSTSVARARPPTLPVGREGMASMSDLRREQLDELDKIRRLFEEKHLPFPSRVFERGLLVPEDRPVLESIHNLPLPGSRLVANPLPLGGKSKATGLKKKKKKRKKVAKSGKKSARSSPSKPPR